MTLIKTPALRQAFRSLAIVVALCAPSSLRAQAVPSPPPVFVEIEPEVSSRTEGLETESMKEIIERHADWGENSIQTQELIRELDKRRMTQIESKGDSFKSDEDLLELFRIYSALKASSDELHEQALPFLDKNPLPDPNQYEQVYKDHGDKVQIVSTDMRPSANGQGWEVVRRTALASGKTVPQAYVRSIGASGPALVNGRSRDEVTFYQAAERQADGSWKVMRSPLESNASIAKKAAALYKGVDAEYKKQEAAQKFIKQGDDFGEKKDYGNAVKNYNEGLMLYPNSSIAFEHRGNAYYESGNDFQARSDYGRASVLDPSNANAFLGRAKVGFRQNMNPGGLHYAELADSEEAVRLNPTNAEGYVVRGDVKANTPEVDNKGAMISIRRSGEAIADYTQALKIDPKNIHALMGRAEVYRIKRDFNNAIKDVNAIRAIDPSSPLIKAGTEAIAFDQAHPPTGPRRIAVPPRHAPGPGNSMDGMQTGPGGGFVGNGGGPTGGSSGGGSSTCGMLCLWYRYQ